MSNEAEIKSFLDLKLKEVPYLTYKKWAANRLLGVEVETEGNRLPDTYLLETLALQGKIKSTLKESFLSFWKTTRDGSLRNNSYEYVFRKPLTVIEAEEAINQLYNVFELANTELKQSYRTSVHIHVNYLNNTVQEIMNSIMLYYIVEPILANFCLEPRRHNLFCLQASEAEAIKDTLLRVLTAKAGSSLYHLSNEDIRYAAMNLNAITKFGSIEYRMLEGSASKKKILKWIDLLLELRSASSAFPNPQVVLTELSIKGLEDFLETYLPKISSLYSIELEDSCMELMRDMQELAYCINWDVVKEEKKETRGYINKILEQDLVRGRLWRAEQPIEQNYLQIREVGEEDF